MANTPTCLVYLSLLLRGSPINTLGVWEDTESQSHISLDGDFRLTRLPNRCFPSVASAWRGITGALDLMTPTLRLRNISSAGLRLRPMPPCAGGKAVFTERKNTNESCGCLIRIVQLAPNNPWMTQLSVFSLLVKLCGTSGQGQRAPTRWYSHLLLSFLILFDGCNHAVAFTLVGKKIPHVAFSGKDVCTFPTLLGRGSYPRRMLF